VPPIGSRVLVRWGLDVVPGVVVDRYGSGSGERLVVRLDQPVDPTEDATTVTVPLSDVETPDQAAEPDPPGSWVAYAQYERQVRKAIDRSIRRAARRLSVVTIEAGDRDRRFDYMIHLSHGRILVEVKFVREGKFTLKRADQALKQLAAYPADAKVLVSNSEFLPPVRAKLLDNKIVPVTWRSHEDDREIERAIAQASAIFH
jgi:hypothetical protein